MCGQMRFIAPPWQVSAQLRFSVNVCCAVPDDQVISPFIFEGLLTGGLCLRFPQEELPQLFEEVPLNKEDRVHFREDEAPPHFFRERQIFPNYCFPWWWIRRGGPHNWPSRCPDLVHWITVYRDGVRNGLQLEGWNARWVARWHFMRQAASEAANGSSRCSQPSGNVLCSRRRRFRKPALSTGQCKLKAMK